MRLFYNDQGEVIGSVDASKDYTKNMEVQGATGIDIPSALAKRIRNPKDALTAHDLKMDGDLRELTDKEKQDRQDRQAKAESRPRPETSREQVQIDQLKKQLDILTENVEKLIASLNN